MAKKLNFSVAFTPDTAALKATMNDLQRQLQDISALKITVDDGSLKDAVSAAKDLQKYLLLATDKDTGNLDLSKFSATLKKANTDITQLSSKLIGMGPQGNQAFMTLARGISQAQIPMKKTNKLMDELWTTMKNTARWQLTSSVMHGFMGALQSAVGYAEDLNKSLTDIQIVSDKSATAMDKFAVKANQAAKELSSTTTEYTKASLIYYQQGLDDSKVKERTDITIKMANVVGESAEEISSYMTAIWNNFDDGSKSLEYYGDAMSALGARTAASSAEIAEGLEKFAAIGETVGLSFDYAAAAVATVVDKTRQSADTVGTAFKTIFSRLQGLQLGETLDDGTDLNKYSEALNKVGISIKTQSGELKDMDVILDELGMKWKLLSRDQQMALAQTVAGTRQYTQMMSLMNNYDDFKLNVEVAQNSEGTLNEQAEIYAKSWEAASNRAQASLEDMYDSLINDDAIIGLTDAFSSIIDSVALATDSVGGFGNVIIAVASIFVNKFSGKLTAELSRLGDNFRVFTGKAKDDMLSMQSQVMKDLKLSQDGATPAESSEMKSVANLIAAKQKLAMISENLTDSEREYAEYQVSVVEKLSEKVALLSQEAQKKEQSVKSKEDTYREETVQTAGQMAKESGGDQYSARKQQGKDFDTYTKSLKKAVQEEVKATKARKDFNKAMEASEKTLKKSNQSSEAQEKSLKKLQASLLKTAQEYKEFAQAAGMSEEGLKEFDAAIEALQGGDLTFEEYEGAAENVRIGLEALEQQAKETVTTLGSVNGAGADLSGLGAGQIQELVDGYREEAEAVEEVNDALRDQEEASQGLDMAHTITATERIMSMASAAGQLYSVYNSIKSLGSIWADEDATVGEKIMSTLMSMSMLIPAVAGFWEAYTKATAKNTATKAANTAASATNAAARTAEAGATAAATGATAANTPVAAANAATWWAHPVILIIGAVLLAVVAAFAIFSAALEANSKKTQENADKAHEDAEALRELEEAGRANIKTMQELLETYKETGEGKSELDDMVNTLAESYDLESAALAKLTGNYEDYLAVQEEAKEKHKEQLEDRLQAEEEAKTKTAAALQDTAENADIDGNGSTFSGGKFLLTLDGYGNESTEQNILEEHLGDMGQKRSGDNNDYDISVGEDADNILEVYDRVTAAVRQMEEEMTVAQRQDSGIYNDALAWLEAMEEDVEIYRQHVQAVADIQAELGQFEMSDELKEDLGVESAEELVGQLDDVSTLEEYQSWVDKMTQAFIALGDSEEEAAAKINRLTENSFNPQLESIKALDEGLTSLATTKGIDKTEAQNYFNSLSPEDQQLFWSIDFDSAKTQEAWDAEIAMLKANAEYDEVQVKIKTVSDAQDSLKENMSADDYRAFETESGIDWGNQEEGIIQYTEFLRMSYQEQMDYLQGLEEGYVNSRNSLMESSRTANQELMTEYEAQLALLEAEMVGVDAASLTEGSDEYNDYLAKKEQIDAIKVAIQELQSQIDSFDAEAIYEELEEVDRIKDELTEEGIDLDEFEAYKDMLENIVPEDAYDNAKDYQKALNSIALANKKMEKGVKSIASNWDDWNEIMSDGNASMEDISTILPDVNDAVQDILNLDTASFKLLPDDFARKHWDLIEDVVNGVEGSVDTLRDIAGQEILLNIDGTVDADGNLQAELMELHNSIAAMDAEQFDVGVAIDPAQHAEFIANCNAIIAAAQMTAEQAQAYFASMGYDVELEKVQDQSVATSSYQWFPLNEAKTAAAGGVPQFDPAQTVTMTETKNTDALAIKTITPTGSYGGGIGVNTTPSKSSTAPKKSGGGGGGGDKPKEKKESVKADPKEQKKLSEEAERYHEISNELETIAYNLDDINRKKDRAFGKDRIKAIKEETKELKKQADAQQRYLDEIEDNLASDKASIGAYGATFDKDGNINNYDEIVDQQVQAYNDAYQKYIDAQNAAVDAFNGSKRDDAAEDVYEKAIEDAERAWEQAQDNYDIFQDTLGQYEETADLLREAEAELEEINNKIYDSELEVIEYTVEVKVEVTENYLKVLEELLEQIGDEADNAADKIANLHEQISQYERQSAIYTQGIQELLTHRGASDAMVNRVLNGTASQDDFDSIAEMGLTAQEIQDLEDWSQALLDINAQYRELRETVYDTVSGAFEEYADSLDKQTEKIERLRKTTDTYKNIIGIVGKKMLDPTGEATRALNEAAYQNTKSQMESVESTLDYIDSSINAMKMEKAQLEAMNSDGRYDAEIAEFDKQIADMEDRRDDTYGEWLGLWEQRCEEATTIYTEALEQILSTFEDSIAGLAGSLDELSTKFERQKELASVYVEDYKKIYELSKLNRDITNSIDETTNIKNKQALKKLQDEINQAQNSNVEMSEYDLEVLRKKYELELARAALEEAQQAKSQVRMTRDSEGNWGYVYTADDSAVADAEQNYEDKLYEMQELNSNYIEELQGSIIQAQQDCSDAIAALNVADFASYEEYQKACQDIRDHYKTLLDSYFEQLDGALVNNQDLYNNDWTAYSEATGYKISADEDFIDSFEETTYSTITGFETMEAAQETWSNAMADTLEACADEYQNWYEKVDETLKDGGTSINEFAEDAETAADKVVEESERMADEAEEMSIEFTSSFYEIVDEAGKFAVNYVEKIQPIIDKNTALAKSIADVVAAAAKLDDDSGDSGSQAPSRNPGGNTGGGNTGGGNTGGNDGGDGSGGGTKTLTSDIVKGIATAIWCEGGSGWGVGSTRKNRINEKFGSGAYDQVQSYINAHANNGDLYNYWVSKLGKNAKGYYYTSFDTGGYTGAWGNDMGKLAMLHQKELVLNADDTKNMLSMIEMVRDISSMIDIGALSASRGLSSLLVSAGVKDNSNALEQHVQITAEFPNATDKNEILEAFDNVINLAAQYANRR